MATDVDAATEADPVVARYNVFLKPQLPAHQKLLVLQYPNRVGQGAVAGGPGAGGPGGGRTPVELRIKATSGMVEVDVPLDNTTAYDRAKGIAWGSALAASTKAKAGGSHGLAGGFGVGGQQGNRGRPLGTNGSGGGRGATGAAAAAAAAAAAEGEGRPLTSAADWSEAVRQDRVLRLQTLGGMCPPPRAAEANWMIGVFDGGNLHLTPVNSLVHLRPQLHHIDAETEVERQRHRDAGSGGGAADGGAGGAGSGGPGGGSGTGGAAARAIHMTIKSAGSDGNEIVTETMADRLRAVQTESWARMLYVGDDDEHSWEVYDQTLFLKEDVGVAAAATAAVDDGKGKQAAGPAGDDQHPPPQAALVDSVPSLRTTWTESDMLQAISKIEKPADDEGGGGSGSSGSSGGTDAARKAPTTGRGKGKAKDKANEETAAAATRLLEPKNEPAAATAVESTSASASRRVRPLARPAASAAGAAGPRGRGGRAPRQAAAQGQPGSKMELD